MDKLSNFLSKEDPFSKLNKLFETKTRFEKAFKTFDTIDKLSSAFRLESNPMIQLDKVFKTYESNPAFFPIMDNHLKGIKQNHLDIFSNWDKLAKLAQTDTLSRQIKNMESILSGVTFQTTNLLSRRENWDLLEDFDEITNEVAAISERVIEQESITKSDLDEIKQLIQGIEIKIDQKDKDFFSIMLKWLGLASIIFSVIMTIIQENRYIEGKNETVTKKEFERFKEELTQTIKDKLTKNEDIRTIGRDCNLRLKPGTRTLVIGKMSKGDKVIV